MQLTLGLKSLQIGNRSTGYRKNFNEYSFQVVLFVTVLGVASAALLPSPAPAIVRQSQDVLPDGSYSYTYETDNGIYRSENGSVVLTEARSAPVVVAQGQYQYTSPDGTPISVTYVADHNGFQPQGAHIPVISPLIQRAIDYIRAHPPKVEEN